jgi:propionyl-CoA carboxylase alpha chain
MLTTVSVDPSEVVFELDGVRLAFAVSVVEGVSYVDSPRGSVALAEVARFPEPALAVAPGSLLAPMPGTVVRLHVDSGAQVTAGQPLLVLEAMKMEHPVAAPHHGVVTALLVAEGSQVEAGAVLAVVSPGDLVPGTDALGTDSLGTDSLGTDALGTDSLGTASAGAGSEG